jgi:hypothetical protein
MAHMTDPTQPPTHPQHPSQDTVTPHDPNPAETLTAGSTGPGDLTRRTIAVMPGTWTRLTDTVEIYNHGAHTVHLDVRTTPPPAETPVCAGCFGDYLPGHTCPATVAAGADLRLTADASAAVREAAAAAPLPDRPDWWTPEHEAAALAGIGIRWVRVDQPAAAAPSVPGCPCRTGQPWLEPDRHDPWCDGTGKTRTADDQTGSAQ